jgi:hypothetical protein
MMVGVLSHTFPSQEKINEAIEKLANLISRRYRMSEIALLILESQQGLAPIQLVPIFSSIFPYEPVLGPVVGAVSGIDGLSISDTIYGLLENPKNYRRLIHRIEEIRDEVEMEDKHREIFETDTRMSIMDRLKLWLRKTMR